MSAAEGAGRGERSGEEQDQRLAAAAAAGDGAAFAALYERHESRAYNLAFRITDSREDAADAVQEAFLGVLRRLPRRGGEELAFGSYVLTSTRNACYDLIARRRRAEPTDSLPETAAPVTGGGPADPGDPEDDPARRQLLAAQREEIRAANERLPERQREVLALREMEELSYDEIAAIMGMNRNSVAQLISRARLNLRAALRGAALESIPAAAPECERALPLISRREDGELGEGEEGAWLASHLAGCDGCRLRREAMQEAGVSYRAWAPIAAAPGLFEATMARAAELVGADWSAEIAARTATARSSSAVRRRRAPLAAAALAALVLVGLIAAREAETPGRDAAPDAVEAATPAPARAAKPSPSPRRGEPPAETAPTAPPPAASEPPASAPAEQAGQQRFRARPKPKPKPEPRTSAPAAKPDPEPAEPPAPPPAPETTPTPPREPQPEREPETPEPEPPPGGKKGLVTP